MKLIPYPDAVNLARFSRDKKKPEALYGLPRMELISGIMKIEVKTEQEDQRVRPENSEVERLWACNLKAKEILGWAPVYGGRAGFVKGLEETTAWFSNANNLKSYKSNIYNI